MLLRFGFGFTIVLDCVGLVLVVVGVLIVLFVFWFDGGLVLL